MDTTDIDSRGNQTYGIEERITEKAMNYYLEDFTEENYRRLLRIAKENYQFYHYNDIGNFQRGIIWRHDIDYSVHRALSLARIESDEGISSTFFVHLHNSFYHVWEKEIGNLIKEIQRAGGEIGLHFEPGYYELKNTELERMEILIEREKIFLEEIIERKIQAFSFHNPDTNGGFMKINKIKIAGLLNVYHESIQKEFIYCSDSNGYWRFKRLEDVLLEAAHDKDENMKLHILTHPAWWQKEVLSPRERIKRSVYGRAENVMQEYDSFLKQENRTNVF